MRRFSVMTGTNQQKDYPRKSCSGHGFPNTDNPANEQQSSYPQSDHQYNLAEPSHSNIGPIG
jgi:hypothetical protein